MISFAPELAAPENYLPVAPAASRSKKVLVRPFAAATAAVDIQSKVDAVILQLGERGFVFEPWQVAAFITAVRTKPFVILAGISGTGKTKLPRLIAQMTDAEFMIVPVKPDWTDSSELLGYERLDGSFQPGVLLQFAAQAQNNPDKEFFLILDEMNLARVEYYLAEVLSRIEEQHLNDDGRFSSDSLYPNATGFSPEATEWKTICLPDNLCLVGSVNMDETTHGFSKKVLDRSFVIEFSTVDLSHVGIISEEPTNLINWDSADWRVIAKNLAAHPQRETNEVKEIIETLIKINGILEAGQLQFGYRVRDEIVMFCLAAQSCADSFITSDSGTVDTLDIAIAMKILPRIQGGGGTVSQILKELTLWASPAQSNTGEEQIVEDTGFPFCADRLEIMTRRLKESGFTNFWL